MKMKKGQLYEWVPSKLRANFDASIPCHGEYVGTIKCQPLQDEPFFGHLGVFSNPQDEIFFVPLQMIDEIQEVN
jgi:hypothetical protein